VFGSGGSPRVSSPYSLKKSRINVWDYAFVMASTDSVQLGASGRLPRPGGGTGMMKRISGLRKTLMPNNSETWQPAPDEKLRFR
jgi:hypothetical protein